MPLVLLPVLTVKKQKHDFHFFFVQCIIKQLLDSVCDIQNNQDLCKGYQLITLTSTSSILDITETSSNNCL